MSSLTSPQRRTSAGPVAARRAAIGLGQAWLSQITAGGSYQVNVLGGVMLTAFGLGIAFPTVSVAVTAGLP